VGGGLHLKNQIVNLNPVPDIDPGMFQKRKRRKHILPFRNKKGGGPEEGRRL
jgi:hypothetical protein